MRNRIATADMSDRDLAGLKVSRERLMEDIHYTCQWGKGEAWGEYVDFALLHRVCLHGMARLGDMGSDARKITHGTLDEQKHKSGSIFLINAPRSACQ